MLCNRFVMEKNMQNVLSARLQIESFCNYRHWQLYIERFSSCNYDNIYTLFSNLELKYVKLCNSGYNYAKNSIFTKMSDRNFLHQGRDIPPYFGNQNMVRDKKMVS